MLRTRMSRVLALLVDQGFWCAGCQVALDVVGLTPLTRPSFRVIWAEPSEDEVCLLCADETHLYSRGVVGSIKAYQR